MHSGAIYNLTYDSFFSHQLPRLSLHSRSSVSFSFRIRFHGMHDYESKTGAFSIQRDGHQSLSESKRNDMMEVSSDTHIHASSPPPTTTTNHTDNLRVYIYMDISEHPISILISIFGSFCFKWPLIFKLYFEQFKHLHPL